MSRIVGVFVKLIRKNRNYAYGNENAKYLVQKYYFREKSFERKIIDKTWVMYESMNKIKTNWIENSYPSYQTYTPTVTLKAMA